MRLVLLVLVTVIPPALILTIYTGTKQMHRAAEQSNREFLNMTRLAAGELQHMINGSRQLLDLLVHLPEVRSLEPALCDPLLEELLKQNPLYANFGIASREGMIICSGLPFPGPICITDRLWFKRAIDWQGFAVGDFQISRTAHEPTMHFSLPFFDDDGRILGVAFAALNLKWVSQLLAHARLPEGTVSTLLDASGKILARSIDSEKWAGRSMAGTPVFKTILNERREGTTESADIDGVVRLYAFTPLRANYRSDIVGYFIVGIPSSMAYADARRTMTHTLALLGAMCAFSVVAAWSFGGAFVLRRTKELITAANRLRAGDLSTRTRPDDRFGEFTNLSIAFDEMAEALDQRTTELKNHRDQLEDVVNIRTKELKQTNEKLREANSELEAFSYSVSHDLLAPLRYIDGFSEMLSKHANSMLDEKGRHYVKTINEAARRMGVLVDDLLVFSRMGRTKMHHTLVDMNDLLKEVIEQCEQQEPGRHIQWQCHPLPPVSGDAAMLRQALWNLFANAVKYSRPRDPALIETGVSGCDDNKVVFFVRDNGVGFDMTYYDKLFGVFQRLHHQNEFEGTGIGLANVQRIIHRHGGRVWGEGKIDGGATFYFSLPAAQKIDPPTNNSN